MTSSTSAWHGASGGHQHARFFPRRCSRSRLAIFMYASCASALFSLMQRYPPSKSSNSLTHSALVPCSPTTNGLPHFVVRSTFTVFSGIFQPFLRLSCTRRGVMANMALNLAPFGRWTPGDKPARSRLALRSASLNLPMHIDNGSSDRINVVGFWLAPARSACDMFALNFSAKCDHSASVQVFGWIGAADYRRNPCRRELFANRVRHVAQCAGPPARNLPAHNHWCHALVWRAVARSKLPRPCYRFSNHHLPFQKSALVIRRRTSQSTRTCR